ncbi:MAG: molybdopterin biosynthesis protein MoeB [Bacteroidia bacterium]|nr:MAG: molybdopterin biosynthesis protein MoeB [Bacteroidia bacterium]
MHPSERFARTLGLGDIGPADVERLQSARVLAVGAGGLGSAALPLLCAQGIRSLTLYEDDTVSWSNLPRQLMYGPKDVGHTKLDLAGAHLKHLHPDLHLDLRRARFGDPQHPTPPEHFDVALDCTDNFATRFALDRYAQQQGIPLVYGAVHDYTGLVTLLHGKAGLTLGDLLPEPKDEVPLAGGVFPPLVQTIGAFMASEAIKLLLGRADTLDGKLLHFDVRDYTSRVLTIG